MLAGILLALSAVLTPPQQDAAEFNKRFDQAVRLSDRVAQDRAVQKYRKEAFNAFLAQVERASWGDEWLEAFAGSWKRLYRSEFPEIYSKYRSGLDGGTHDALGHPSSIIGIAITELDDACRVDQVVQLLAITCVPDVLHRPFQHHSHVHCSMPVTQRLLLGKQPGNVPTASDLLKSAHTMSEMSF